MDWSHARFAEPLRLYAHLACLRGALHPDAVLRNPYALDDEWLPHE
jgi:hypothetical protein